MKLYLCHSTIDDEIVEEIGARLKNEGNDIWIDNINLLPGDSIIEKIGEGISESDRLIAFLTPDSVSSNWVKKEIATGLILEITKKKNLDKKFVIPCKLKSCEIPILLIDKIYADFTNKSFDKAYEELLQGINGVRLLDINKKFQNSIFEIHHVSSKDGIGKFGVVIEFKVKVSPTNGAHIIINSKTDYVSHKFWFNRPNTYDQLGNFGVMGFSLNDNSPKLDIRFLSPNISTAQSLYLYLETNELLIDLSVSFLNSDDSNP